MDFCSLLWRADYFALCQLQAIDSMCLLTFRYDRRSCSTNLCLHLKLGMQDGLQCEYFIETLHFTSNLFCKWRLLPGLCRFWVTWCSVLFPNVSVIWVVHSFEISYRLITDRYLHSHKGMEWMLSPKFISGGLAFPMVALSNTIWTRKAAAFTKKVTPFIASDSGCEF